MSYLGIDLGTSGLKALLVDEAQREIGSASAALKVAHTRPGWSEQDPATWIAAAEDALGELARRHPHEMSGVKGIGLSGQMHGATLLDAGGKVLRPCILWNDTRSHEEAAALDADPAFRAITGNIVFPGFTAPKLAWVKANEPDLFRQVAKVLLPKDYLRLWLCGELYCDMSDAAGTAWLDVGARRWSAQLLAATDLSTDHMPALCEGTDAVARMRPELAARFAIASPPVIAGGAGDNAASACGMGVIEAGQAFVSLGTSGVLFAATPAFLPAPASAVHAFCHALPGTWHQMGVILAATDCLNWLGSVTGAAPDTLTRELGESLQAPGSLTFLPYLSGERTPHNDAAIRGAFAGLSLGVDRQAMTRAVVEGVAFALADNLEALKAAGTEISSVIAVGGGSRSPYWLKVLATALDLPVHLPAKGDFGAAFGAARLGLIAAENARPAEMLTAPPIGRSFEPEAALRPAFEAAYRRFAALYPALRGVSS